MNITIHLPVTPAIKKFLEGRLGKNYQLSLTDWFGGMIIHMLDTKKTGNYTIETKSDKNTEVFNITASIDMANKNGFTIEAKHEQLINKIVNSLFRQELYTTAIINKKEYGIEYQTTLSNIMDAYDITEEEFSTDALKRDLIRKKETIESRLYI